ncbi:MAG: serine/threonine protein kinase [Gemmataceae bacterium]|nr:serine/threonine protein kinase [Gemmataceae bacterium]
MKIGKFTIFGPLGAGAHSTILHIQREEDATSYALKIVSINSPEELKFKDQAEHEFRVAQMLDHPNLVKIYALEPVKDWLFRLKKLHMLIQFVNGKTLDEAPRLSIPRVVQVFSQVAAGVAHLHEKDVFHSDLKPNNIMLGQDGIVRVVDYGLARLRDEPKVRLQGTPEYMAPEQAKHYMVNERTDIYSFGAAMYRMITSRLPPASLNEEEKPVDLKTWLKNFKPVETVIPTAPKALADLVNRCLSFQATSRPESMEEIQTLLEKLANDLIKNPDEGLEGLEW